jgi:hypothetical protein
LARLPHNGEDIFARDSTAGPAAGDARQIDADFTGEAADGGAGSKRAGLRVGFA